MANNYESLMGITGGQVATMQGLQSLSAKWDREASVAADGAYPDSVLIDKATALSFIYQAIRYVDPVFPIPNKTLFANTLLEQQIIESGQGKNEINTCLFSGTGPAGITQFSRGTWKAVWKLMNWEERPLQDRCDPWYGTLAQVIYMAYLMNQKKGTLKKALRNYNGDTAVRKNTGGRQTRDWYADIITNRVSAGNNDYAGLMRTFDPSGALANEMRTEFP